jgi:hypothetical protein
MIFSSLEMETFDTNKLIESYGLRMCHLKGKKFLERLSEVCNEEITYQTLLNDSKVQRGRKGGTFLASKWEKPMIEVLNATATPQITRLTAEVKPIEYTIIQITKNA